MEHRERLGAVIIERKRWQRLVSYCKAEGCPGRRKCKDCRNIYSRGTRPKHAELSEEARRKANCRAYTHMLIKRGKLVPQPCEDCGALDVEPHHDDYTKPRLVRWKCREHHRAFHQAQA